MVSWRPGQEARIVARLVSNERIFTLGDQVFVTAQAAGRVDAKRRALTTAARGTFGRYAMVAELTKSPKGLT